MGRSSGGSRPHLQEFIRVNLVYKKKMEMDNSNGLTENTISENGRMEKEMAMGFGSIRTVTATMDLGKREKVRVMASM
jgi:hypothetical protein